MTEISGWAWIMSMAAFMPFSRTQSPGWEATTVKTLIGRLVTKGVIRQEKRNVFYYRAVVSEKEYNDWATGDLIRRLYRGSAKDLVAALVHADELSAEDVEELRAMFREGTK